jgi:hypothetical protein
LKRLSRRSREFSCSSRKNAAKTAVEAIFNYAIARRAKKDDVAIKALGVAEKAMAEVGHTSRRAIEAVERIALNNGPAVRLLVTPIGQSCEFMQVGSEDNGAFAIDAEARAAIETSDPYEIGPETIFEILMSEIDLKNRSCKFRLREDDDPEQRYSGEITDPQIALPRNPYSAALDSQRWIHVKGKAQLRDGEIERLYISDIATVSVP